MTDQSATFAPRRAIVTAADSGIGRATAVALAQAGMDVGITWHADEKGAQDTASEVAQHNRRAVVRQLDTTDLDGSQRVIAELAQELGGLDVLVNNAGTGASVPLLDLTVDQWRTIVATDLDGAFACLQQAAKIMVAQGTGGRLIAVSSVHEHQPRVGSAA